MKLRAQIATLFRPREDIYEDAVEGRRFHVVYFGMMVFACLISLFGLLLNSPAVIIGAMLISPLMGPLLACGVSLATAEWSLGLKAGRNVLFSVVETVAIAALAAYLSPLRNITPEIVARTNPNLIDLLIALFSGVAGTVAFSFRKGGMTILPGVAIATAVMPPLATVGYGVSTGRWQVAGGAFMLFITNFTAIVFSSALAFFFIGFRPSHRSEMHRPLVRWRVAIALLILAALAVPLMRTLIQAARQQRIRKQVEEVLAREFDHEHERRVSGVAMQTSSAEVSVTASIQTESYIDSEEIEKVQSALAGTVGAPVHLHVRQLQLAREPRDETRRDFVSGGAIKQVSVQENTSPAETITNLQGRVRSYLSDVLNAAGLQSVEVDSLGTRDGILLVRLTAEERTRSGQSTWNAVSRALSKEMAAPVELTATVTLAGAEVAILFKQKSARPAASDLHNVRRRTAEWRKQGYENCEAKAASDELAPRRIDSLREVAACEVSEIARTTPGADSNTVTLRPFREVLSRAQDRDVQPTEPRSVPAER